MEERRDGYSVLLGRPDAKRPLGRPRRRWEDNIRMDHQYVKRGGRDCQGKGQMAGCSECGTELSGSIKCGEFLD
jgi:hypothetical protein